MKEHTNCTHPKMVQFFFVQIILTYYYIDDIVIPGNGDEILKNKPKNYRNKKQQKELRTMVWIAILTTLCFIAGAFWLNHNPKPAPGPNQGIRAVVNGHLHAMKPSEWFLENGRENLDEEIVAIFKERRQTLINAANAWCPTNSLGNAIKKWIPQWGWCIATKNDALGKTSHELVVISGRELMMFVPRQLAQKGSAEFFCNQEKDGRLISIHAYKMPDQIYAAFALHEVGHAHNYWIEKHKTTYVDYTEEVEMHILTADILDAYSHGKYRETIRKIVDRQSNFSKKDFQVIFPKITRADLEELDRVVGAIDVGQNVEGSIVMQHLFTIAFEAVDRYQGGILEKRDAYLLIGKLNKNTN